MLNIIASQVDIGKGGKMQDSPGILNSVVTICHP